MKNKESKTMTDSEIFQLVEKFRSARDILGSDPIKKK